MNSDRLSEKLLEEGQLMVSSGTLYGEGGENFIRLNIACPRKLLVDGLKKLRSVLNR